MNNFQFSDFQLSQYVARRPALAERPLPPMALRNPIEAAEALFRELGLDRFLERRALPTQKRVEAALAFASMMPETGGFRCKARSALDTQEADTTMLHPVRDGLLDATVASNSASALPTHAQLTGSFGQPAGASFTASTGEGAHAGEEADYFIDAPWFADEAGAADDVADGQAAGEVDLNDPAREWTSEDIMMLILRDDARAAQIAAWKEAAVMRALEAEAYAEAA